ncbi:MAG: C39 family peptidase [bacterium]
MTRKLIGVFAIAVVLFLIGTSSPAGIGAQGGPSGTGGGVGGMIDPLQSGMLVSQMMGPALQAGVGASIGMSGIGILTQVIPSQANALMGPVSASLVAGGIGGVPLNPGVGTSGALVMMPGMYDSGVPGLGMPGLGGPGIETLLAGIIGPGNLMGQGRVPVMGIAPGWGMGFWPGPLNGLAFGALTGAGVGPVRGMATWPMSVMSPRSIVGGGSGLVMGYNAGPMTGPGLGLMTGLGAGPVMGFGPGSMMGLAPGPMMGSGMPSSMGFSPGPMMGFMPGTMMGMPDAAFPPWGAPPPSVYQSGPLPNGLYAPQNIARNNVTPQPGPGQDQTGNRRVVFLGTSVEGTRPDGTPNIVRHYLDTYTGRRMSGYSQGVEVPAPEYHWWYGCSPTSAGMVMGYYDIYGYNGISYDLVLGGVAEVSSFYPNSPVPIDPPVDPPSAKGPTLLCNKAIASAGHLADFWLSTGSTGDPLASGRLIPSQFDCLGDFMGTSQDNLNSSGDDNPDGQTFFYFWTNGARMTNTDLFNLGYDVYNHSGAYGMIEYTQYCGYRGFVFNQYIVGYQGNTLGFSFSDYVNEIDAGRPVLLHLSGHMMLGTGYYLSTETVLVHDVWNNSDVAGPLTMPWGGTYQDPDGTVFTHFAVTCFTPL